MTASSTTHSKADKDRARAALLIAPYAAVGDKGVVGKTILARKKV